SKGGNPGIRRTTVPQLNRGPEITHPCKKRKDGAVTSPSLARQSVALGHHFEFRPDCVRDGNYRTCLHRKCREHRTKLVNRQRIVAVHQQVPAPIAHTNHEELDLEIRWRLPLTKYLQDSLLRILVLRRRTLRAFIPTDHVFHLISFDLGMV